jgi:FkbH-like protein
MFVFDNLKYNEIIAEVNKYRQIQGSNKIKIGIIRNITVDNYLPLLKYLILKENFNVEILQGAFDMIMQEVLSSHSSISKFEPDLLIVFLNIELISPNIYYRYAELTEGDISDEKEYLLQYLHKLFEAIKINIHSKVIFHLFELPTNPSYDIAEIQNRNGQRNFIDQINTSIIKFSKDYKDIYFVDLNIIREKLGDSNYYDRRYWYIGKVPYTLDALKEIAREQFKIIKALYGRTKKCLVLDCDNTLWGGIIGEDGIEDIKIGNTYPGNMYLDFQRQILNLFNKGVILAINSKNNEAEVLEVLEKHPEMLLKRKHFACVYANWNNKVENLKQIALDLNIGMDSIVFIDDSEFECNLIKESIEEVTVIQLPKETYKYADIIADCGLFDKLQYTDEDKNRSDLYRVNIDRKKYQESFSDINSYYKSLEMKIDIRHIDEFSVSRVSQLTQRTNQFNLTTKRYSEDDIRFFMQSEKHDVLILSLSDKFGEMGIVGVQILDFTSSIDARIDSFMMSCRIIGRGVENVFLRTGIEKCITKNYKRILGLFTLSKKNLLVSDFYNSNGFEEIISNESTKVFSINSIDQLVPFENNFKEIIIH